MMHGVFTCLARRTATRFWLIVFVVTSACARREEVKLVPYDPPKNNIELVEIVRHHMIDIYGWNNDEFRVYYFIDWDSFFVYRAVHRDDEKLRDPGGGRSVDVLVDKATSNVIRVLRQQ